jgi:pimeloyl-ACP methyl ester carboxylesterase
VNPPQRKSSWLNVNGLEHHLNIWDGGGRTTLLMLHGFLDVGASWSFTVDALPENDWHVVAPDWRGHGDSEWIGKGGYYHFTDYIRDIHQIAQHVRRDRLIVVAHSMGAMAAIHWLGACPELADGVILVEAVGPLPLTADDYPGRMKKWLHETAPFADDAHGRPMVDYEHVERRLSRRFPRLSPDIITHIAKFSTRKSDDGAMRWKYDPLHRTTSPMPALPCITRAYLREIRCPALWIGGQKSPFIRPILFDWLKEVPHMQQVILPEAGHLVHTEVADKLAGEIMSFVTGL